MYYGVRETRNGLRYSVAPTRGRIPVVFVDYHHKKDLEDDPRFRAAIHALWAFKDGDHAVTTRFAAAMADAAAAQFRAVQIDAVVPVLGRRDLTTNRNSRASRVARVVAEYIGARVNLELFSQARQREGLHLGNLTAEERKGQVDAVLACADAPGRRILLVDDVFTTGSTLDVYGEVAREHGARVVGAVVMMKYENDRELLNPGLYE